MSAVGDVTRFGQIDAQADPEYFVHFVDEANAIPGFQELEDVAVAELHAAAGDRVLDLGCGTGEDTRRLAALVGPTGSALGIDISEAMLTEARRRTEGTGLAAEFRPGDATALDLPDGSFDRVR